MREVNTHHLPQTYHHSSAQSVQIPEGDPKKPAQLLFALRRKRTLEACRLSQELLGRLGASVTARGRSLTDSERKIESHRYSIQAFIKVLEEKEFLDGPVKALLGSRSQKNGSLSQLALVTGMLCVAKAGIEHPELAKAIEVSRDEECYREFIELVDPDCAKARAVELIECVDSAGHSLKSEGGARARKLESLLSTTALELGRVPKCFKAEQNRVVLDDDNTLLPDIIMKAFTKLSEKPSGPYIEPVPKCDEYYSERREAVRCFNELLLRVRRLGVEP